MGGGGGRHREIRSAERSVPSDLERDSELGNLLPILQRSVSFNESCHHHSRSKESEDVFRTSRTTNNKSDGGTEQDGDINALRG
jgi:hypothetical protein